MYGAGQTGRTDTGFSFDTTNSTVLKVQIQDENDNIVSNNETSSTNRVGTDIPSVSDAYEQVREAPKREKSFRNLFKKKNVIHESDNLQATLSPPLSPISNISYISDDESNHTSSMGDKLSAKWRIRRENFDKNEENDQRLLDFSKYLADHYYNNFNYHWQEIAELYLFGQTISTVFNPRQIGLSEKQLHNVLLNWLLLGGDLYGEEVFSLPPEFIDNIDIYSLDESNQLSSLLKFFAPLVKALEVFKQAIAYFKENTDNYHKLKERDTNVQTLESVANKKGLPIPLSQVLLANWLIQFNSSSGLNDSTSNQTSTFTDQTIMKYFRRSARNSLVLKLLYGKGYFNNLMVYLEQLEKQHPHSSIKTSISIYAPTLSNMNTSITNQELHMFLASFLNKDNQTSLGLSLYGIANSYHVCRYFNKAINLFEVSANLTSDLDCCTMAAIGLSNGYGFGKKHGKDNRLHRKKRIAKIYRIIKENGGVLDVGTSWAFKSKYD